MYIMTPAAATKGGIATLVRRRACVAVAASSSSSSSPSSSSSTTFAASVADDVSRRRRRWHSSSSSSSDPPPPPPPTPPPPTPPTPPPRGLSARINSYVERLRDEKFHESSTSFSWGPDDLGMFEPRVVDTPPVAQCANKAQIYESRGFEAMSSLAGRRRRKGGGVGGGADVVEEDVGLGGGGVSSSSVGFDTHDGPVPIGRGGAGRDDGDALPRGYGSLMDPFYVPPSRGQTHLIQGGTPCDIPCPATSRPYRLADYGEGSVHTLVLLRHGESEWNATNRYTGWCDANLTRRGEGEARAAGRLLAANGIEVDHAFTSVLKRASYTCNMCLNMAGQQLSDFCCVLREFVVIIARFVLFRFVSGPSPRLPPPPHTRKTQLPPPPPCYPDFLSTTNNDDIGKRVAQQQHAKLYAKNEKKKTTAGSP